MRTAAFLLVLFVLHGPASGRSGSTPQDSCLADVCVGSSAAEAAKRLALPPLAPRTQTWLLTTSDARYLEISVDPDNPDDIFYVLYTSLEHLPMHSVVKGNVSIAHAHVSTSRGIEIGSPVAKVLSAYGTPAGRRAAGYPWQGVPGGAEELMYSGCITEMPQPAISFFVQRKKVVGIAIWLPDC